MTNADYVKEYLEQMQGLTESLSDDDPKLTYRSIHAGQALIYSVARDAKRQAEVAEGQSSDNKDAIRRLMYVIGGVIVINLDRIPALIDWVLTRIP